MYIYSIIFFFSSFIYYLYIKADIYVINAVFMAIIGLLSNQTHYYQYIIDNYHYLSISR